MIYQHSHVCILDCNLTPSVAAGVQVKVTVTWNAGKWPGKSTTGWSAQLPTCGRRCVTLSSVWIQPSLSSQPISHAPEK